MRVSVRGRPYVCARVCVCAGEAPGCVRIRDSPHRARYAVRSTGVADGSSDRLDPAALHLGVRNGNHSRQHSEQGPTDPQLSTCSARTSARTDAHVQFRSRALLSDLNRPPMRERTCAQWPYGSSVSQCASNIGIVQRAVVILCTHSRRVVCPDTRHLARPETCHACRSTGVYSSTC